jgi:hypothetical protein
LTATAGTGSAGAREGVSDINELGIDEQLTRMVRTIAMTSEFDLSDQVDSQSTRRTVVATGVKLAYVAPIVAASLKVSALSASAAVTGAFCGHSVGTNGGCMGACTSARLPVKVCDVICGTGQIVGACPVVPGSDNPCCNPGYCIPANFKLTNTGGAYIGPKCPA